MIPFRTIIRAANTVSRATLLPASVEDSSKDTIKDTSITVTAKASRIDPKGWPSRWATVSA